MIELKRLSVENFRCFESQLDLEIGKITLLTGANSSGKSSFMYSFLGALQSSMFPYAYSANGQYVTMGDFTEFVTNHDVGKEVTIGFVLDNDGQQYSFTIVLAKSEINTMPAVKRFICESPFFRLSTVGDLSNGKFIADLDYNPSKNPDQYAHDVNFRTEQINFINNNSEIEKSRAELLISYLSAIGKEIHVREGVFDFQNRTFGESKDWFIVISEVLVKIGDLMSLYNRKFNYVSSYRRPAERTYLENQVEEKIGPDGKGFVDVILHWEQNEKESYNRLLTVFKDMKLINDLHVKRMEGGRFNVDVQIKNEGTYTSLSDVGFGVSQALPIVVADIQLGNESTLYAAQPEIHVHPSVQAEYASYIVGEVARSNKRYIIETHSEYLLNRIRLCIVKGLIAQEDVKVYYLGEDEGSLKAFPLQFTEQGQIIGAPDDFFQTYMMDVMNIAIEASE